MRINIAFLSGCFRRRQPLLFVLGFIFISIAGCNNDIPKLEEERTLFEVNGIEISVFEFQQKYITNLIQTGRNDSRDERYRFLDEMIDNLVLASAADEKGLLTHPIYTQAIYYQQRKSMMDVYFVDEMDKLIEAPTDDELRLAYAKRQRKVYVRHLFSRRESDLAESYERLQNGENFIDVANDFYETTEYDSLAGYLGYVSYFGVDDAFAEAAYSTNQGEFTAPVRSLQGFHIIYVDYIEFPALLAEDEYQYRKQGVTSQVRLRKQSLVSNEYVRDLMGSLVVEVNSPNIQKVREALDSLSTRTITNMSNDFEQESDFWDDNGVAELKSEIDGDLPLLSYVFGGNRIDFTMDEYLDWLPYLSYSESMNRTATSIGRGLRNEVLYKIAENNEYKYDERVIEQVENRGYDVLSELYQFELYQEALEDTSAIIVPNSYLERLIQRRETLLQVGYWKIYVDNLKEAEDLKEELLAGSLPMSYDLYEEVEYGPIESTNNDYELVKSGILNLPLIAHTKSKGWMILYVQEREVTDLTGNVSGANLTTKYRVYSTINEEIIRLRKEADIEINTELFEEIYKL